MPRPLALPCFLLLTLSTLSRADELAWPAKSWEHRRPEQIGLSTAKFDALRDFVGGRGCIVKSGYMVYTWGDQAKCADVASAMKPVITTLMLLAVQDGKISSVDEPVARFEPRLRQLNAGKDAAIAWRHLASQTSGYGLSEPPGQAYSYNDYALALYYDTLMDQVYRENGTKVLQQHLADPLGFEDRYTFEVFGPKDRPGRLGLSVRDFARFGLLYLRGGLWRDKQILKKQLVDLALTSPIPADIPLTSAKDAPMLPAQRTIGGNKNITPEGPGWYSFNWWINGKDKSGHRMFDLLPPDMYMASGHGSRRVMMVIPSWDLILVWNDSEKLENNRPNQTRAAELIRAAAQNGEVK